MARWHTPRPVPLASARPAAHEGESRAPGSLRVDAWSLGWPHDGSRPRARPLPRGARDGLAIVLYSGALLRGEAFFERDLHLDWYPRLAAVLRCVRAGDWPLGDPGLGFGQPLLAALGATRLAARLGSGRAGAYTAGLAFALSGPMQSSVNLVAFATGPHGPLYGPLSTILPPLRMVRSPIRRRWLPRWWLQCSRAWA